MNREALKNLARVVEEAPDEGWNMHFIEADLPCGTVRCAWGWCQQDRWFQNHHPDAIDTGSWSEPFDISEADADILFGNELGAYSYENGNRVTRNEVSKLAVLANIRRLLAGLPAKEYIAVTRNRRRDREERLAAWEQSLSTRTP